MRQPASVWLSGCCRRSTARRRERHWRRRSIREADYALDHLHDWLRQDHVHTPLLMERGHVRVRQDPLGVTLIIGAWNEPYMLTIGPLVAAIAAGNTAVVKPSEICEACAAQLAEMVPKYLDPQAVAVAEGGIPETRALLAQKWDLIFFTGSPPVGKIVHQAAAKNLTPAVLELGGKNPTIVHSSAELKTAAHRIAFTCFINSGFHHRWGRGRTARLLISCSSLAGPHDRRCSTPAIVA